MSAQSSKAKKKARAEKPTAGLVVEGDTEFAALPLLHTEKLVAGCPPLRAVNLGGVGSHLQPIGVAKMVFPKVVQHMVAERSPIVVCIDREQREATAGDFAQGVWSALFKMLTKAGRPTRGVFVVIADRTFEAWLLADARGLHARRVFEKAPKFHSFEGELGKEQKKGVVELGELLGREYAKTVDGPKLWRQLEFPVARLHGPGKHGSASLDAFLHVLGV